MRKPRFWAIRIGNPKIHKIYYLDNRIFDMKMEAIAHKHNQGMSSQQFYKVVEIISK